MLFWIRCIIISCYLSHPLFFVNVGENTVSRHPMVHCIPKDTFWFCSICGTSHPEPFWRKFSRSTLKLSRRMLPSCHDVICALFYWQIYVPLDFFWCFFFLTPPPQVLRVSDSDSCPSQLQNVACRRGPSEGPGHFGSTTWHHRHAPWWGGGIV